MGFFYLGVVLLFTTLSYGVQSFAQTEVEHKSSIPMRSLRPNYLINDRLGVGAKWGTLTGVSVKYWTDDFQAVELTAAFADSNSAFGVDYLWNFRGASVNVSQVGGVDNLIPFAGIGLLSSFGSNSSNTRIFNHDNDNFGLAARVPLGVEYLSSAVHLGVFGEIGLGFGFIPNSYSFATADLGARYYF